jgi:SAM-dependent methyltransferase
MAKGLRLFVKEHLLKYTNKNILVLCPKKNRYIYEELKSKNNLLFSFQAEFAQGYGVIFSLCHWPFRNKVFDIIILQDEIAYISDLDGLLKQVYAKLTDDGMLVMTELRSKRIIKLKDNACKNIFTISTHLINIGFIKVEHKYYDKNGAPRGNLIKPLFLFTNNYFLLLYKKQIIPLTPFKFKEVEKAIKVAPVYASLSKLEINNKGKK